MFHSHTKMVPLAQTEDEIAAGMPVEYTTVRISCAEADQLREYYGARTASQAADLKALNEDYDRVLADNDNLRRLIAGALKITFKVGPRLRELLNEVLTDPTLTDEGSAVKIENELFTLVVDPFGETIRFSSSGLDWVFGIPDGRMTEHDQTLLCGLVHRAKARIATEKDPVSADIDLVRPHLTVVAA